MTDHGVESLAAEDKEQIEALKDPRRSAEFAGLHYVSDAEPGFTRRRCGRGFTFLDLDGETIREEEVRERIKALVIPPAWEEVWICADPDGHLQATGRDEKGRKQYLYHERYREVRDQAKFFRLVLFGQALPQIRERADRDQSRGGLKRERVVATLVRLLEQSYIRVGNDRYAEANDSYGLTTLRDEHVDVHGATIEFDFRGKSGQEQHTQVRDARAARVVRQLSELPGHKVFQYLDDDGKPRTIGSGDVNDYLRETTGESFTAKDYRTWAGTLLMAANLWRRGPAEDEKQARKVIVDAVKEVADQLGNTPAVCRSYYIHPDIPEAYADGSLFAAFEQAAAEGNGSPHGLRPDERAVLSLLCERLQENGVEVCQPE